jgi:PAS domain S-box-containing protein
MDEAKSFHIEYYKDLFYKSPLGIFTATLNGRYIEVNDAFTSILGYSSSDELLSVKDISVNIYVNPGERERLIKSLQKEKKVITHETQFKKKNGDILPVRVNFSIIENSDKENFIVGLIEDISKQVDNQIELLREKKTLFTLIENIPDHIYYKDSNGNLLIANKSLRNLIESNQTLKKSSGEVTLEEQLFEGDSLVLEQGAKISDKILTICDNSGNDLYIDLSKFPIVDKDKITGLIGIGRDISELKKAELQITESQSNLHALIESSNDLIWSVDPEYRLVIYNTAFSKFFKEQYGKDIAPGDSLLQMLPSKVRDFWKISYNQALKGESVIDELTVNTETIPCYYECSLNPIFNKFLKVVGISVVLTDISERKLAEHAIRESEERFRQLAENTSDAFILWDNTGILYANPAFEKIFGMSIDDALLDMTVIEKMIAEEDRPRFIKNRRKETLGKQKPRNQQYILKRNRRSSKLIWARHFPVYNVKGKIYRYVTVTSDLTEQKQLEDVLTATRSQQQALLDNIPFLAWLKDKNGRYISVNTPFAEYYNTVPEDIIGKTDYDLLPAERARKFENVDKQIILSGERQSFEAVEESIKGKEWIEVNKSPIFNEKGEVIGLTGISREITDRKRLEEAILKNEEHFRALLQYSSDAITILDENGVITFESSLRNRILNFTVEELVGKEFKSIVHPEDVQIFETAFAEVFESPKAQIKKEYRSLHKNKRWIYVESIFTNHLDNPSINGIVVNTRDISDRKMSELKEKAYHNNLIFLSNSALELLSISEREDIYKYIADKLYLFLSSAVIIVTAYNEGSDKFEIKQISGLDHYSETINKLFGEKLVGMEITRKGNRNELEDAGTIKPIVNLNDYLQSSVINQSALDTLSKTIKVNKIYSIFLARNNKLLGNITILTLNKTIIKFKHIIETFAHQVAVALHRSQLEFELVSAKLKAEESDRLKTAFLANMSHEIRTPMNGILGFAEMLNDDAISDQERKKYLDIINSNGKVLINLIDDIIDFAKIEAGQIKVLKHDFSLNTLLTQIYNSFLTESLNRDSKVELILEKGLSDSEGYVSTDPVRLRQIFTNLIGNAYKFTTEGHIRFGYKKSNGDKFLEFYVEDTGIGIDSEKLGLVFERFVQADSSRSRKYSGSGLGLAISNGFVELLGGTMWVESEVKRGSTFYFKIPFERAKTIKSDEKNASKPKSEYNWSEIKVLVAEDDFFSFKFLEGFLKQTQATVLHAEDGNRALEICQENEDIDIVLMDVQMPEMNGLDATQAIKKFRQSLPIIAQTANAIAEEKQKCFEAGFDDFVTKPINITELFMKMEHWLLKKRSLK